MYKGLPVRYQNKWWSKAIREPRRICSPDTAKARRESSQAQSRDRGKQGNNLPAWDGEDCNQERSLSAWDGEHGRRETYLPAPKWYSTVTWGDVGRSIPPDKVIIGILNEETKHPWRKWLFLIRKKSPTHNIDPSMKKLERLTATCLLFQN